MTSHKKYVLVPQSALDWLFGSGPDADGNQFGGEDTTKGRYWWRSHFRKLIADAPPCAEGVDEIDFSLKPLSAEQHAELMRRLDEPAKDNPALRKLLTEPSVFENTEGAELDTDKCHQNLDGKCCKCSVDHSGCAETKQVELQQAKQELANTLLKKWDGNATFGEIIHDLVEEISARNLLSVSPQESPGVSVLLNLNKEQGAIIKNMRAELLECQKIFSHYADLHFSKGTVEGSEKGSANAKIAGRIERLLNGGQL